MTQVQQRFAAQLQARRIERLALAILAGDSSTATILAGVLVDPRLPTPDRQRQIDQLLARRPRSNQQ